MAIAKLFAFQANTIMLKKFIKVLSNIFLWTSHTDPWCNVLQTVYKRRKYIGVISSDQHTLSNRLADLSGKIATDVVTPKIKETIALQGTNIRQNI